MLEIVVKESSLWSQGKKSKYHESDHDLNRRQVATKKMQKKNAKPCALKEINFSPIKMFSLNDLQIVEQILYDIKNSSFAS